MIFIPLLMGHAFAFHANGRFSWNAFLFTLLFGMLYQVYLLYTNDHADEAIDKTTEQYWLSGGSRVLPEGRLSGSDLLTGARAALVVLAGLTVYLGVLGDRPWMPVAMVLAVVLSWAYHRRPLQLSYRGHGETLQGLGCGILLPLIGFYMQQGSWQPFPWGALIPLYLVFHAGNIVTALPDYQSDKKGRKRTFPVRHGELVARTTALGLLALAYVSMVFTTPRLSPIYLAIVVIPSCLMLIGVAGSGLLRKASVADFPRCKAFVAWMSASQAWFLCAWAGTVFVDGVL